ncbi:glycoside hydrolase family 3 N-terminal domain-containing protein [Kordiimonas sp.]|uniref:glycoside hydrolase family 3 protein n=1 Tax=Kordiimonas sp. TaxID=1970157 RepID=UPI003A932FC0
MFARFRLGNSKKLTSIAGLMLCCSFLPYTTACASEASFWPKVESPVKKDDAIEAKVSDLLSRMSLEEKVGQIMQVEIQYVTPDDIKKYHVGSVLNGGGSLPNRNKHAKPSEWLALADSLYKASMDTSDGGLAIPIIWGSDAVHGHNNVIGATIFPHNIGLGAANNPALMKKIGEITALEMRATGIDWTFAPTVAVAQNDRWGRAYESYSESPEIVKAYAGSMVLGLQGTPGSIEFLDVNHVVATAKHFLGDGGTEDGDDQGNAKISEQELRDIHAAGYQSALEAGVQTVMASFSSWNGEKMHGNKYLLTDVLKGRMGFDGFVVGDWNGHGQVPGCTNASCAASVNAGLDLFMVIEDWKKLYANTLAQVKAGEIAEARLDDAVARILRVKLRAGLFEKGMPSARGVAGKDNIIGRPEHRDVARQAVRESLVLLKNNGHVLPVKPHQTILVAGDGADNIGKQTGGWTISWQGTGNVNSDFPGASSIYQGIAAAVGKAGGETILSVDGSFENKPDVAIVVMGEEPYAEGQGDLETLEFEAGAKKSLALIRKLKSEGIPVVTVFLSGRPLWVNPELNASDAFVAAWLPGTEGDGVADVLIADELGEPRYDFKGRLSFSWPKTPLQDVLNKHHEAYDPLFAYGYGLSYTLDASLLGTLPEQVEGVQSGELSDIKLYAGRTIAPWMIILSDETSFAQLSGAYAALPTGSAKVSQVDKDIQGDALHLEVATPLAGNIAISAGPALDWSAEYAKDAAYEFDVNVEKVEGASVSLQCGENCTRTYNLSAAFEKLEGKGWQTVSVPLACLAKDGDVFDMVSEPFRLTAQGPAELTVANVALRLGQGAASCP